MKHVTYCMKVVRHKITNLETHTHTCDIMCQCQVIKYKVRDNKSYFIRRNLVFDFDHAKMIQDTGKHFQLDVTQLQQQLLYSTYTVYQTNIFFTTDVGGIQCHHQRKDVGKKFALQPSLSGQYR